MQLNHQNETGKNNLYLERITGLGSKVQQITAIERPIFERKKGYSNMPQEIRTVAAGPSRNSATRIHGLGDKIQLQGGLQYR